MWGGNESGTAMASSEVAEAGVVKSGVTLFFADDLGFLHYVRQVRGGKGAR